MGAARHRGRHREARVARQPQAAMRDGGRHRERRVGRQPDRSRRGDTAVRSMHPNVTAAVALAGASVIAVTPVAPPPPPEIHVSSAEVRLAAASSVWNIPMNLIQDIINIPYNEVQGINTLGQSLLFTGTWWLASSTNVWGTDSADMAHYYGLAGLIPFPAISNAVAAQITGLAAALLPINSGCNNVDCPNSSALIAGYFQPARIWSLLTAGTYTFDATPVANPDGTTHPPEGLWSFGGPITWGAGYGHPEWDTTTDPATGEPVVPWAGTTFTSNPLSPISDYLTHLMSDPTSPENAIKFPTLQQIATAVWNLVVGLFVDFSPIFPGSPYCLGLCGRRTGRARFWRLRFTMTHRLLNRHFCGSCWVLERFLERRPIRLIRIRHPKARTRSRRTAALSRTRLTSRTAALSRRRLTSRTAALSRRRLTSRTAALSRTRLTRTLS